MCPRLRLALATAALLLLAGCLETLNVTSTPPGATITVEGGPKAISPAAVQIEGRDTPYRITVAKEGYDTEVVNYSTKSPEKNIVVALAPLTSSKRISLVSSPAGATVALGSKVLGVTPMETEVTFRRAGKDKPWEPLPLTFALADHQSETVNILERDTTLAPVALALLRAERTYRISTRANGGSASPIAATLAVAGAPAGSGPETELKLTFKRSDKAQVWPTFALRAEITAVYQPRDLVITFDTPPQVDLVLDPVTEVAVERLFPVVELSPTGPKLSVSHDKKNGTIDTAEPADYLTGVTRVTDFGRRDLDRSLPVEALNSYALLPSGAHVVISVTTQDAELAKTDPTGSYSAHLELRGTEGNSQRTILTNDPGYLDTAPVISPFDGAQPYIIFQSNRGDFSKPDLYRLQLDERNAPLGGLARITTDARFNYAPACADTNRVIVYLSLQPNYARAQPQLCTITKDGALPTQFPITATEVNQRDIERVFFTKRNERTGLLQIFYMQPDGKLVTQAVSDPSFAEANSFNPAPAFAKGGRVLFVSDRAVGKGERADNNIYVMNANGSGLQRLTSNGSDDILPCWSPREDEPDVFYFVSNRGGAYNLWRARLVGGK